MEEKIKRLKKWAEGEKTGPLSLEIWPTNRCNLHCIMCGTWASRRKAEEKGIIYDPKEEMKRELPDEVWLKIVNEAFKLDIKEFLITGGGEPLMRKELTLKIMEKIKENEGYGTLNTNGTLITSQDIQKIISIGWDMVIFSIDGPDKNTHDFIRGVNGTFEKVKKVLFEFKKQKEKLKTEKPKVVFNTVVLNKNFEKLCKLVEFASSVDCESITFIPLIAFDNTVKKYKLNLIQRLRFNRKINEIENLASKLGVHTNIRELKEKQIRDTEKMDKLVMEKIKSFSRGFKSLPCFEPFLHLLITPEGRATCCCMLAGKGIKGNFAVRNLKDVWFGEWFSKLREQFLNRKIPKDCGTCVFSQFVRNEKLREELNKIL